MRIDIIKNFTGVTSNIPDYIDVQPDSEGYYDDLIYIDWKITALPNYVIGALPPDINEHIKPDIYISALQGYEYQNFRWFEFVNGSDNKEAELTSYNLFNLVYEDDPVITISCVAIPTAPDIQSYGSINSYLVDYDVLGEFSAVRFVKLSNPDFNNGGSTEVTSVLDLGDYVHSIKKVYFDLPSSQLPTTLWCGAFNTDIEVNSLTESLLELDFETVLIPTFNNSISDYENTIMELYLPFVGYVNLSNDYIGTEIRLVYKVDLIKGVAVIYLYSNGVLIQNINCEPFSDIIYRRNLENSGVIGKLDNSHFTLYGLKPFVKIKWYEVLNNDIYNSDNVRSIIGDLTGWNKIIDVEYNLVSDSITFDEVQMLNLALSNGILIK